MDMPDIQWSLEKRKLKDLTPHGKNPRKLSKHDYEHLKNSLGSFGCIDKPVINTDNTIIGGHQRVAVLKKMGIKEIECWVPNKALVPQEADELNIRLNRNQGEWDFDILANQWDENDLMAWGFEAEELNLDLVTPDEEGSDVPEVPKNPITKVGDLYEFGEHRLLCGDSTDQYVLERLLNDQKIDSLITDPPYGVDNASKNEFLNKNDKGKRNQTPIINDIHTDYKAFFTDFLKLIPWADENTAYIFMSGQELHNLRMAIEAADVKWGSYLVWVKNNHVLGRKDYNTKHEFIVYGWHGKHKFYGPHRTTVLEYDKPLKNDLHPTMKPIEIIDQLITDGSAIGANVYDPFLGSGSTLIACEQLNRKCFGLELAPEYCDVIIKRWINYRQQQGMTHVIKKNGKITSAFDRKVDAEEV